MLIAVTGEDLKIHELLSSFPGPEPQNIHQTPPVMTTQPHPVRITQPPTLINPKNAELLMPTSTKVSLISNGPRNSSGMKCEY